MHKGKGKNSQIPQFFKIISVLPMFEKYLAMYHFFKTRVFENRIWHGTQVYENRVWHETRVSENRVP